MIEKSVFGTLPDGRVVTQYTIRNRHGEYVELLDLGASLHSVFVRDKDGRLGDVVLGVTEAAELTDRSYEGVIMGRVGNRIANGRCVIDGEPLQLEQNTGGHCLHSGSGNYAYRLFTAAEGDDGQSVTFRLDDRGEGGWKVPVDAQIRYTFDDDHRLTLHYTLTPEGATLLSPTNHAYFNLNDFGDAREHILTIHSENLAKKGPTGVPEGQLLPVKGTPADFTAPRRIGDALESEPQAFFAAVGSRKFDDFYVMPGQGMRLFAELYAPATGRRMRTWSDMQCLILFTPDNCTIRRGKRGITYLDYSAVCLETQFVPNAVNCSGAFEVPLFRKGEKLETTTVYEFV